MLQLINIRTGPKLLTLPSPKLVVSIMKIITLFHPIRDFPRAPMSNVIFQICIHDNKIKCHSVNIYIFFETEYLVHFNCNKWEFQRYEDKEISQYYLIFHFLLSVMPR